MVELNQTNLKVAMFASMITVTFIFVAILNFMNLSFDWELFYISIFGSIFFPILLILFWTVYWYDKAYIRQVQTGAAGGGGGGGRTTPLSRMSKTIILMLLFVLFSLVYVRFLPLVFGDFMNTSTYYIIFWSLVAMSGIATGIGFGIMKE